MRYIDKLDKIDGIIKNDADAFLLDDLPTDDVAQGNLIVYFINTVSGYDWLEPARTVFEKYQIQFPTLRYNYLYYLEKTSAQTCENKRIAQAALTLSGLEIPDWLIWLRLIKKLDWQSAIPLIEQFINEVPSSRIDGLTREMDDLAIRALEQGNIALGLRLLDKLLRFVPFHADEVKSPKQEYLALLNKPEPPISAVTFSEVVKKVSKGTPINALLPVFTTLCELLNDAIDLSVPSEEREDRDGDDGSSYWRPAIEDNEQNRDYDPRAYFVGGIRDLAARILSEDSGKFSDIEALLGGYQWVIFKRLYLHLIREFPELAGHERISKALLDSNLRGTQTWHEWALLLRMQFRNLDSTDQQIIFDWIQNGFDPSSRIKFFTDQGEAPDNQHIESWKHAWQFKKLSLISDNLPNEWESYYKSIKQGDGDLGPPEFHHWTSGVRDVQQTSPISKEDILNIKAEALIDRLKDWKQEHPFEGPAEDRLWSALRAAGAEKPNHFLHEIEVYRQLKPRRYLAIVEGCIQGGTAGVETEWPVLLNEIIRAVPEVILPNAVENDKNLGIDIIRGLEDAIKSEVSHIPIESKDAVFGCLKAFLNHPYPEEDGKDKESPGDLAFTSLNSARLVAIRALFDFESWVRKNLQSKDDENPVPQVIETLGTHLPEEKTLAGRGVFGERLGWLLHIHRNWVEKNLSLLFPDEVENKAKRDAVWNCFVTMQGASKVALELLDSEYRRAISEITTSEPAKDNSGQWKPDEGLVHHLCAYYWWGMIPLPNQEVHDGTLLAHFYQKAPSTLREYLLDYIGRSMRTTQGEVPEDIKERFRQLIEWRLESLSVLTQTQPDEVSELHGYFHWFDANKLAAEWSLKTLMRVLELTSKPDRGDDFLILRPLADYTDQFPEMAIECLHRLEFTESRTPRWWGYEKELKKILRKGFSSTSQKAQEQAAEVQDSLLRAGWLEFRNLNDEKSDLSD